MIVSIAQFLLTKAAITGTYATIYTFMPELFPTVIRNTAMGVCSMIARVGAISASYIAMWLVSWQRAVFGGHGRGWEWRWVIEVEFEMIDFEKSESR